jgi:hypothetical protein
MKNKLLITALAATMAIVTAVQAPAETIKKKKKPVNAQAQSEESANKELMDDVALGIATGILGQAMKKGKMPKGGKEILKHGLKAVKDSAKKSKDGGKKDSGKKKDPLKALFGADEE